MANLEGIEQASISEVIVALGDDAAQVLTEGNKTVPEDTGLLKKSGRVIRPSKTMRRNPFALIRWGGVKAFYAVWVHEMPASFNFTKPGSGPKWATNAVAIVRGKLPENIAKKVGAVLRTRKPAHATVTVTLDG